jgi:transposase-like protein
MAVERVLSVCRSAIYRWVQQYGSELENPVKSVLKKTCDSWKLDETYIKVKGKWSYLCRAIDKHGQTLDWMLSLHRNKASAKRFFKKTLKNDHAVDPWVINVDKSPTFVPASKALQKENIMPASTKLRPIKYLSNEMENDHKFTKCTSRYRQRYQPFQTASYAISVMESMRMVQKRQIKFAVKGYVRAQNESINKLFDLAA